ncbi:XRE family transcriptional regulator [Rhizobium sophoriradicis]|uniref:helix-turn-helix domain-containing protein n=1 Tax=Rhizobium sophoriradicis TaxID=1535245 RepID=UPI00098F8E03|nr:helix-turn-helix domain-containing protein [Rhizobium sophoriradicis]RSC01888.1 XRE family transcriptional regulator [Rhizobium sophoriradicis]
MITGAQIRSARAIIKWEQKQLAQAGGVSVETIKRLEKIDGPLLSATGNTVSKIQVALEAAGVTFIDGEYSGMGGPGVRLRDPA